MRRLLPLLLCWPLLLGAASRSFDDADDWVDMGNIVNTSTGSVSFGAWFKGTEDAASDHIIGKKANHTATTDGYVLRQNTTDNVSCQIGDGAAGITSSEAGGDADGAWNFYVCTWDGSNDVTVLYANGVQVDTDTAAMGNISSASTFRMGADASNGNDANGNLAGGFVYGNCILTAGEVNEIRWVPESVPICSVGADNISGAWPMWGDASEMDLSGNARVGTPNGTATSADGPPVMYGVGPL